MLEITLQQMYRSIVRSFHQFIFQVGLHLCVILGKGNKKLPKGVDSLRAHPATNALIPQICGLCLQICGQIRSAAVIVQ